MALITDKQMGGKPKATATWFYESFGRGMGSFCGRITPAGERLFYYRYTNTEGKQIRLSLGTYSPKGNNGLTVAEGRAKAQAHAKTYKAGATDLKAHLEAEQLKISQEAEEAARAKDRRKTLRQVFDQWILTLKPYIDGNGKRRGRKDAGASTREHFNRRVFDTLGSIPIEEIKKPDILAILAKARDGGKLRTANVLLADLKQLFKFAAEWEYILADPVATIKKKQAGGADVARTRHLTDVEIKQLVKQIPSARLAKRSQLCIMALLCTGVRISELVTARWDDVDLKKRKWFIPTSKNQREHTIYLSDFALKQFEALQELREKDKKGELVPWIFPNTSVDNHIDIKTIGKQFADRQRPTDKKLSHRSKNNTTLILDGGRWTAHDLRRTGATIMSRLGVPADVIDECLNHMLERKVSRVYIQDRRWDEQRVAFIKLGAHLEALIDGKATGKVVNIAA